MFKNSLAIGALLGLFDATQVNAIRQEQMAQQGSSSMVQQAEEPSNLPTEAEKQYV